MEEEARGRGKIDTVAGSLTIYLPSALTVPFPSPVEAEIAHWFLTSHAELRGPVRQELDVNVTVLTVLVLEYGQGRGWWPVARDDVSSGGAVMETGKD